MSCWILPPSPISTRSKSRLFCRWAREAADSGFLISSLIFRHPGSPGTETPTVVPQDRLDHLLDLCAMHFLMVADARVECFPLLAHGFRQPFGRLGQRVGDDQLGPRRNQRADIALRNVIPGPGQFEIGKGDGADLAADKRSAFADRGVKLNAGRSRYLVGLDLLDRLPLRAGNGGRHKETGGR